MDGCVSLCNYRQGSVRRERDEEKERKRMKERERERKNERKRDRVSEKQNRVMRREREEGKKR